MRIRRFNEKLADDDYKFAEAFSGSVSHDILDYLQQVIDETNLKSNRDEVLNSIFNAKEVSKYLNFNSEIEKLENQIEELHKSADKIEIEATSKAVFLFQEKLLFADFPSFYRIYMDRTGSGGFEEGQEKYTFYDIHPKILNKYRTEIEKKVIVFLSSSRFDM